MTRATCGWQLRSTYSGSSTHMLPKGLQRLQRVLVRETGETLGRARALMGAGCLAYGVGDYGNAECWLKEAEALARTLAEKPLLANAMLVRGAVAEHLGDEDGAESYFQSGLAVAQEVGHVGLVGEILPNLSDAAYRRGDLDLAERFAVDAIAPTESSRAMPTWSARTCATWRRSRWLGGTSGARQRRLETPSASPRRSRAGGMSPTPSWEQQRSKQHAGSTSAPRASWVRQMRRGKPQGIHDFPSSTCSRKPRKRSATRSDPTGFREVGPRAGCSPSKLPPPKRERSLPRPAATHEDRFSGPCRSAHGQRITSLV